MPNAEDDLASAPMPRRAYSCRRSKEATSIRRSANSSALSAYAIGRARSCRIVNLTSHRDGRCQCAGRRLVERTVMVVGPTFGLRQHLDRLVDFRFGRSEGRIDARSPLHQIAKWSGNRRRQDKSWRDPAPRHDRCGSASGRPFVRRDPDGDDGRASPSPP